MIVDAGGAGDDTDDSDVGAGPRDDVDGPAGCVDAVLPPLRGGPRERIPCLRVEKCVQLKLGSARAEKSGWMGVSSLTVSWVTWDTSYDLVGDVGGGAADGADDVEDDCEEERVVGNASVTSSDAAGDADDGEVSHDAVR